MTKTLQQQPKRCAHFLSGFFWASAPQHPACPGHPQKTTWWFDGSEIIAFTSWWLREATIRLQRFKKHLKWLANRDVFHGSVGSNSFRKTELHTNKHDKRDMEFQIRIQVSSLTFFWTCFVDVRVVRNTVWCIHISIFMLTMCTFR